MFRLVIFYRIFFFQLVLLFIVGCGKTAFMGKEDNPADDDSTTSEPATDITGAFLTCSFIEEKENTNLYGCVLKNKDQEKFKEKISDWKVTVLDLGEDLHEISGLQNHQDGEWQITFEIEKSLVQTAFRIFVEFKTKTEEDPIKQDLPFPLQKDTCPAGYLLIPGDQIYETSDFCVMKFEAKLSDNSPYFKSYYNGLPQNFVSHFQVQRACQEIEEGKYALISNREWMTIATNIAAQASNWEGGEIGKGRLNIGITALGIAASDNDNEEWSFKKRIHVLSNNQVIWDFSGNLSEYVLDKKDENTNTPNQLIFSDLKLKVPGDTSKNCPHPKDYGKSDSELNTTIQQRNDCLRLLETNYEKFISYFDDINTEFKLDNPNAYLFILTKEKQTWWKNKWSKSTKGVGLYRLSIKNYGILIRGGNDQYRGIFFADYSQDEFSVASSTGFRCVYHFSEGN